MSEANNIPAGGPIPRPSGEGLPKVDGGLKPPAGEDVPDTTQNDGDRGEDVGGMAGEG